MIQKFFRVVSAATFTIGLYVQAHAASCSFLNRDPLTLRDTELFYSLPKSGEWRSLDETSVALGGQTISFAYVIRERLHQRRSGVVVLKSGRNRLPTDPAPRTVELVRVNPDDNDDGSRFDNGSCGPIPEFGTTSIAATSYDRYHDLGDKVPEIGILTRFHYKYRGRHDRCRLTNDSRADSKVPKIDRSNRGQFSFNPNIVGNGTESQVIALASPNTAYAGSSEGLAEQRVEIKSYRASLGLPTCVLFTLKVPAATGFVRINDLEGLARNQLDFIRADEKSWSLNR